MICRFGALIYRFGAIIYRSCGRWRANFSIASSAQPTCGSPSRRRWRRTWRRPAPRRSISANSRIIEPAKSDADPRPGDSSRRIPITRRPISRRLCPGRRRRRRRPSPLGHSRHRRLGEFRQFIGPNAEGGAERGRRLLRAQARAESVAPVGCRSAGQGAGHARACSADPSDAP